MLGAYNVQRSARICFASLNEEKQKFHQVDNAMNFGGKKRENHSVLFYYFTC